MFGSTIVDYQLTQAKLGRMAVLIQAGRQFGYPVATLMAKGQGAIEASMVKAYVCKAAEWVTREAMQIHGGFGYAEEYTVSRLFVDARVLSIFEGADETLCLKVIARRLDADPSRRCCGAVPCSAHLGSAGNLGSGQTSSASERIRSKSASGWSSKGSRRIGWRPAAVAPPMSIVTESPT